MISELITLRKELHQRPELSGKEKKTAKRIEKELEKLSPDVTLTGLGGTGVLALFRADGAPEKKTILFRAELDAIAVEEETGLPYHSKNRGVMHGCGHDGHMAILIGLAHHLRENRPENCTVALLFQPAEETGEGAVRILEDQRFGELHIDHAYALHNLPGFDEKSVIVKDGVFASASTGVEVRFKGRSSHAAHPENGVNPSPQIVELLRNADEKLAGFRKKNKLNKSVNTFIKLGERAFGISPGTGEVGFTLRSPSDEQLEKAFEIIKRESEYIGRFFEGEVEVRQAEPFSSTVNGEEGVANVLKSAADLGMKVERITEPFPWSEDFGEFRKKCPITLFGLGSGNHIPLHSEIYDFNDNLIKAGIDLFKGIIQKYK